jgi:hypothetical protein
MVLEDFGPERLYSVMRRLVDVHMILSVEDWIGHFCESEDVINAADAAGVGAAANDEPEQPQLLGTSLRRRFDAAAVGVAAAHVPKRTQPLGTSLMRRLGRLHVGLNHMGSLEGADVEGSPVHAVVDLMRRTNIAWGRSREVYTMQANSQHPGSPACTVPQVESC